MGTLRHHAVFLFSCLLLAGALSAEFSNLLEFHVADASGHPVESALITGKYQRSLANSCSDSSFVISTDSSGYAQVRVENIVKDASACLYVSYTVSYGGRDYYWGSQKANLSGYENYVPVGIDAALEQFNVTVLDYLGRPLPGANLSFVRPVNITAVSGPGGAASFYLAPGAVKSITAKYGNVSVNGSTTKDSIALQVLNYPVPTYSNKVQFRVLDIAGNPLEAAIISGNYQKSLATSCSDGSFAITTGPSGFASTTVQNIVQGSFCTKISYSVSYMGAVAYVGTLDANITGTAAGATVVFPVEVGQFNVTVLDYLGNPLPGAAVYLQSPVIASRVSGQAGNASFLLPHGSPKLVFADFENASVYGSTSSDSIALEVPNFYSNITVNATDSWGAPVANAPVVIRTDYSGSKQYSTDSRGIAFIPYVHGQSARISVESNGTIQNQSLFLASPALTANFIFPSSLSVELVSKIRLDGGCYLYFVRAWDADGAQVSGMSGRIAMKGSALDFPMYRNGTFWSGTACPQASGVFMAIIPYHGAQVSASLDSVYVSQYSPAAPAASQQPATRPVASGFDFGSIFPSIDLSQVDPLLLNLFGFSVYLVFMFLVIIFRNEILSYAKSLVRLFRKEKGFGKQKKE
ncbi:MAG: hypothetical protein WC506_05285 [Candidatus Micrarchaeia archaeon]